MKLLEKICEELSIKLGEEWLGNDGRRYKVTQEGVLLKAGKNIWTEDSTLGYRKLITGELKPRWKPEFGETYYVPETNYQRLYNNWIWEDDECDRDVIKKGIVFKTREEAIACAKKMLNAVKEG